MWGELGEKKKKKKIEYKGGKTRVEGGEEKSIQ